MLVLVEDDSDSVPDSSSDDSENVLLVAAVLTLELMFVVESDEPLSDDDPSPELAS